MLLLPSARELQVMRLKYLKQRCRRRSGHRPGLDDVTHMQYGTEFFARPNFYYFEKCGRPCYLPLNPAPYIGGTDWAVTEGWPCEYYVPRNQSTGPYCIGKSSGRGDWVRVIGQVRGQLITNEIGQSSDVWDVILITRQTAVRNNWRLQRFGYTDLWIAYAPDMWLGNTGRRNIPFDMPEATATRLDS